MNKEILKRIIQEAGNCSQIEPRDRFIDNLEELEEILVLLRGLGLKIVLTQGTFDLYHVGHQRYINQARSHGDILIVGIDDDEKARARKGENRPVIDLIERMEIVAGGRSADIVVVKRNDDPVWHLIKIVHPDVLIAVEGTYSEEEKEGLKQHCGEVVVLERQAETSTSSKIRKLVLDGADVLTKIILAEFPKELSRIISKAYTKMKEGG